jgi:hypothetical protein
MVEIERLKVVESYSFIRDVMHSHRFHSGTDDAILDLVEAPSVNDGKYSLFDLCARSLHRSVISSFRSKDPVDQLSALGRLSYLESFVELMRARGAVKPGAYGANLATLRRAIESYSEYVSRGNKEEDSNFSVHISVIALVLPLLFVVLQFLQIPCIDGLTWSKDSCVNNHFKVPQLMLDMAAVILENLLSVSLFLLCVLAMTVLLLGRRTILRFMAAQLGVGTVVGDIFGLVLRFAISSRRLTVLCLLLLAVFLMIIIVVIALRH